MILAKLGDTDITKYINYTSYNVSSVPITNEWTDANYNLHSDEVRRRIEGSFDLAFTSDTDYNAFISLINSNKAGNLLSITLYVGSDVNALVPCYCYYKIELKSRKEANESYIVTILQMTVKER